MRALADLTQKSGLQGDYGVGGVSLGIQAVQPNNEYL